MIRLVALHGTGDAYLVCALTRAFERYRRREALVVVKPEHAAVPEMFGLPYEVDEEVRRYEDPNRAAMTENLINGARYFVHPSFTSPGVRIDQLTAKPNVTQADMYRALMHLPPDAPLETPRLDFEEPSGEVIVIPEARSWPNCQPGFWPELSSALTVAGHKVTVNDATWSLCELLQRCGRARAVVGPQCGVTAVLCAARFPCRKVLVTPNLPGAWWHLPAGSPFPYAYTRLFIGETYDADEYELTDHNHLETIGAVVIALGHQRAAHDPAPVALVEAPMSPGDFVDRLAILGVKSENHLSHRDYLRYRRIYDRLGFDAVVGDLYRELVAVHQETYDLFEEMVPAALGRDELSLSSHVAAMKLNQSRTQLRNEVDRRLRGASTERKSYYR